MADTETPASTPAADSSAVASTSASAPASDNTPVVGTTPAASSEAAASSPAIETKTDTAAAAPAGDAVVPDAPAAPSALASEPAKEPEVKPETKVEEKKVESKVEEKKPEAKTETKPEGEQAELPKFEAFKLPDGFKADEKVLGEVNTLLGQLELAKGDHKVTQETGQKLVDLHAAALTKTVQDMTDYYKQVWEQQKADDFKALQKDPVLGGDAKALEDTARGMANFLAKNGGTKEEVTEFRKFVQARGVDNALPMVRVLNNLKAKIEGYENESSKMLPGTKPMPSISAHPGKDMIQKLYGKK